MKGLALPLELHRKLGDVGLAVIKNYELRLEAMTNVGLVAGGHLRSLLNTRI